MQTKMSILHTACLTMTFLLVFSPGCKKKDQSGNAATNVHNYYGTALALRNGNGWTANVDAGSDTFSGLQDRFYVAFDHETSAGEEDAFGLEEIVFGNLRKIPDMTDVEPVRSDTTGKHEYSNTKEFLIYSQASGDAIGPTHTLLLTEPHFIEITSFDTATKEFWGKFGLSLVSFDKRDTLRFTDGSFYGKI